MLPCPTQAHSAAAAVLQGSGKSVALAAAVEFARLCGAVVLYIPSCKSLVDGGMYHKSEEGDGWNTPDQARAILNTMLSAHGHRLQEAVVPDGSSTLREITEAGLSRDGNVCIELSTPCTFWGCL